MDAQAAAVTAARPGGLALGAVRRGGRLEVVEERNPPRGPDDPGGDVTGCSDRDVDHGGSGRGPAYNRVPTVRHSRNILLTGRLPERTGAKISAKSCPP